MKKKSHFSISQKFVALLLSGVFTFSLAGCSKRDLSTTSPKELLSISDVMDLTLVDELIEGGKLLTADGIDVVSAAEKLEEYLDIVKDLSKFNFKGVSLLEPLTDEQCEAALCLTHEEYEQKKSDCKYKGNDPVREEQKITALKMLAYLKENCENWIHKYGQDISFDYMMAAVKGAVADELGMDVDEYSSIKIDERSGGPLDYDAVYTVSVDDTAYRVKPSQHELWDTIHYIYAVQEADLTSDTEYKTYRKALDFGKLTMAAGANIKKDKLVAEHSESYVKKNYALH